ncbi:MAG: CAP domain-containing protein [Chloroflexaceae bacterium]|nr:CAP domain-containing protein [Chloroflexaceae bacterium]
MPALFPPLRATPATRSHPSPSPVAQAPTAQKPATATLSAVERAAYEQINQYRRSQGLPPLQIHPAIVEQARNHSRRMAQGQANFSHVGFEGRIQAIAKSLTYRSAAENIAFNQGYSDPASQAVQGWLKSPGHHKNIVGNFTLTGVGVAQNSKNEYYFTQIFLKQP